MARRSADRVPRSAHLRRGPHRDAAGRVPHDRPAVPAAGGRRPHPGRQRADEPGLRRDLLTPAARPRPGRPDARGDGPGPGTTRRRRATRPRHGGTAMAEAIHIEGLVKSFGRTRALDGLDLTVRTGEVHGFLGPNGAGKSTTIRVLLGLLRANGGEATLLGGDPWADAVALHRRLAYVPGDVSLWPNLTGGEAIDLLGRLRGGLDPTRRAELLDLFELN